MRLLTTTLLLAFAGSAMAQETQPGAGPSSPPPSVNDDRLWIGASVTCLFVDRVWDGDTFECDGQRWRLAGIDAPQPRDPLGNEATTALIGLLATGVTCEVVGHLDFGLHLAQCWTLEDRDIAEAMLRSGMACAIEFQGVLFYEGVGKTCEQDAQPS